MKPQLTTVSIAAALLPLAGHAALIATENFDYADGSIVGQTGGTGWNYERTDEPGAPAQAPSDWDNVFGNYQVVSSSLVTNDGGVKREFGGATEGSAEPSNEREGAFRGSGAMFFAVSMTVSAMLPEGQNQWAGASSYDFNDERVFFGLVGQSTAERYFGIAAPGFGADTVGTIPVVAGVTYTMVGMLDFDNDLLGLWVNPDGSDDATSFDVSKAYEGGNWSTALRLASGNAVTWDNLRVGTTFADVSPIPEPSAALLALAAAGTAFVRRRR